MAKGQLKEMSFVFICIDKGAGKRVIYAINITMQSAAAAFLFATLGKPERSCLKPFRLLAWRRCRRLCPSNSARPLRPFTGRNRAGFWRRSGGHQPNGEGERAAAAKG
jgi:hypothetical protein